MTWSKVQQSPQATSVSGSITPTFSGGTTAGNLLAAVLVSSGAGTWTLPTNWVQGPGVTNSFQHAEIWYYIGNPGGITSVACTYSNGAANSKGAVAEFHSDTAGTVVANAPGTGTAGAVDTCPVASDSPAADGDLGLCTFIEHFTTATAITWTDPAGWTALVTDYGSAGNHQYSGFKLSLAAQTVNINGHSSVASDSANGWAGALLTFSVQASAPPASSWSKIQQSASQATSTTGSVTGTLPASSGGTAARPRLVVAYLIASGGGTWNTPPAGWAFGPDFSNGGYIRASQAYFIDTGGTHVGTSTVFGYSNAGSNVKCFMAEYDPGADGLTIALNAQGSGQNGAAATCTAATGTAAAAGDLATVCFAEHFTSNTAVTWTTPTGWAAVGGDTAAAGNHQWAGHLLDVATTGTLTVQGKSSTATTSANGWAAAIATFTAAGAAPGQKVLCGAWINAGVYAGNLTLAQAVSAFGANSGRPIEIRRFYYSHNPTTMDGYFPSSVESSFKADSAAGRKLLVSFAPNPAGTAAQATALDTTLAMFRGYTDHNPAGLDADICLWHEPFFQDLTAAQYHTMISYYGEIVRSYGYRLICILGVSSVFQHNENTYYQGLSGKFDALYGDFYDPAYLIGARLGQGGAATDCAYWADQDDLPFGLGEIGCTTDPRTGLWWSTTQAKNTAFLAHIQSYFTSRLKAGKKCGDLLWWNSTKADGSQLFQITPIVVPDGTEDPYSGGKNEYRNALWASLVDAVSSQVTLPLDVATTTLEPATLNVAYSDDVQGTGGVQPYAWDLYSGALPGGLGLSSAGVITGTPSATGTFAFTVRVTDDVGATATQALSITVGGSVQVLTSSLPDGTVGTAYLQTMTKQGGTAPFTWSLVTGNLPPGLALNSSTGVISGTPTTGGTWSFKAKVTDSAGLYGTATLSITIAGALARPVSASYLLAVSGSHQMDVRATLVTTFQTGVAPDGSVIPVLSGDVLLDGTADIRATLDLETDGTGWDPRAGRSALQPYGTEIYVERGVSVAGSVEWVGLGYYRIYAAQQQDRPNSPVRVSGRDRMSGIIDAKLVRPVRFGPGASVAEIFTQLITDVYPGAVLEFDWDADADVIGKAKVARDDRYGFLRDLADSRGKLWYFDYRGISVIRSAPSPESPAWTVAGGTGGVLVSADRNLDRDGAFNAVVAQGDGAGTGGAPWAVAYDSNPASPTYYSGVSTTTGTAYGKVPGFFSSPNLETNTQCRAAAAAKLARILGIFYEVDFSAVPNPALQPYDPVLIDYGSGAGQETHVLQTVTIPLTPEDPLTATSREQGTIMIATEESDVG